MCYVSRQSGMWVSRVTGDIRPRALRLQILPPSLHSKPPNVVTRPFPGN